MSEKMLNEAITQQIQELFQQLNHPVEVLFFGRQEDCDYCGDTLQLMSEVTALSDKLRLRVYDIAEDEAVARQYRVDKAPGLVIAGQDGDRTVDYGIRYAGIPAGHEFGSLIQDLVLVSQRESGLSQKTRDFLGRLNKPVLLQVFVTPTCPYCPQAVTLAHRLALESSLVEAEMVEATEFPDLSDRFNVSGVPQTTINSGAGTVVGAVPEEYLVAEIREALKHHA